ncbi:MAG: TonB-dependent receptor, partial [Phenylobacterium sp.]
ATLISGDIHGRGGGSQVIVTSAVEQPLWGGKLRLNGRVFSNPYNANEADFVHVPDEHLEHEHDDDNVFQTEAGLNFERPFGERLKLELVGLRQDKDEVFASAFDAPGDAERFRNDSRTAETIVRGVLKFQQRPTLSWEAGGEGAYNTLDSKTGFVLNGAPITLPAANVRVEEKRGELFGKATWRPMSNLTLEAGIREEGSQIASSGDVRLEKSLYFTKPRLLITWAPDADTQVRLRYERVVGQLDFGAFVASTSLSAGVITAGNPNLEPEKAWVSEAAIERRFLGHGAVVATLRHSELTDVVDRAPFGNFDAPANIGDGTKDELILNLTLPFDRIGMKGAQLRATSTWRRSEVTDPTTHTTRPITRLRPNEWEAHFVQDLPARRMSWGFDICCARIETIYRFNEVEVRKLDNFVALFTEWKPKADLNLRFEYDYLTRFGYRRTLYHYAGPRGAAPLAYVEDRDPHFGHVLYVRVRKTFGG